MPILAKNFLTMENAASEPGSSWSLERLALVVEALRSGGHFPNRVRLQVYGESMLPALWPRDEVEIASCSLEDVRPGEIVLALREGRLFLHRFVGRNKPDGFVLRGDSMPRPDPQYPPEALLGRLVCDPLSQGASDDKAKWSRAVGMLLCYCGLARRLARRIHSRRSSSRELQNSGSPSERAC